MNDREIKKVSRSTKTTGKAPVTSPAQKQKAKRTATGVFDAIISRAAEPSTWAGVLTIGSVMSTGGVAAWLNPTTLPVLLAGLGLIASKDGRQQTNGGQ